MVRNTIKHSFPVHWLTLSREQEALASGQQLEQCRDDLQRLNDAYKLARAESLKQADAHRQELEAIQQSNTASADLQESFQELQERLAEMEQELNAKCAEIEEYDDKILESVPPHLQLYLLMTEFAQGFEGAQEVAYQSRHAYEEAGKSSGQGVASEWCL